MARVLDVPYAALGDMSKKQPLNISVLTLGDSGSSGALTTTYSQAKRMMPMIKTTGRRPEYHEPAKDRRPEHTVRDVAFAKWENVTLPPKLTLDQTLQRVVSLNASGLGNGPNHLLKIKVKFTDGSDICFARDSPTNPATLKYSGFYSPNGYFDKTVGKTSQPQALSSNGLPSASMLHTKQGTVTHTRMKNMNLEMPDPMVRKALFNRLDPNGNGMVSLAELDKGVMELWPQFDNKPAIMRAYKAADINGSGWIGKHEFEFFLKYLVNYNKVWSTFSAVDTSKDRRISWDEYLKAASRLEPNKAEEQHRATFQQMDKNGGGYVLFDEFCEFVAKKKTELQLRPDKAQIDAFHEKLRADRANTKKTTTGSVASSSVYSKPQPLEIPDKETLKALFRRVDPNGNGLLSLAELDKAVIELWPRFNNKPAILRAYKAADVNDTGFIGKSEFEYFLRFLTHYSNLWAAFAQTDSSGDRRINQQEFLAAAEKLGIGKSEAEARQAFVSMDRNHGGYVLFDEFCTWMAKNKADCEMPKVAKKKTTPKKPEAIPTPERRTPPPKTFKSINLPDAKARKALFNRIDPNGNGMLSLAELDKAILELWPQFDNKPAIMRAYKAADKNKTGWIGKREFEFFLRFLVHYNNLWSKFTYADSSNDRRVSRKEFLDAASELGLQKMSDSQLSSMFDEMDKNKGGYVLFDEFCAALGSAKANEEMA